MKFTRNDLVTVKNELVEMNLYGMCFASVEVMRVRGKNLRIKDIVDDVCYSVYGMDNIYFTDEMLMNDVVNETLACSKCGKTDLEDVVWDVNGQPYCKECAHDMFVVCSECASGLDRLTQVYHEMDGQFYCDTCFNQKYATCSDCGAIHPKGEMVKLHNGNWVCADCVNNYVKCSECGLYVRTTDAHELEGNMMCETCMNSKVQHSIKSYHEFHDWEFRNTSNTNVLENNYIGYELEVEAGNGTVKRHVAAYVAIKKSDGLIVAERDGSLNDGFEMISHPMTMDFVRTEGAPKFKDMFNYLISKGVRSHDTSTCGLHFHVNRADLSTPNRSEDAVIDNILLIVETFKKEIEKFARRSGNSYCRFLTTGEEQVYLKTVKNLKEDAEGDRYKAVNLCNQNTIEFRVFKGTLKFGTFMASMELVNNIVNIAKHSELNGLTWKDVINYNADTNQYIVAYNDGLYIESTTKLAVLSPIEEHRDLFTFENFMNDKFAIKMEGRRNSNHAYALAGALMSHGIKYPNGQFANIMGAVMNHYSNGRTIHISKAGRNYVLRRVNSAHEVSVSLGDIIDLWNEYAGV